MVAGAAVAVRPTADMLAAAEDSAAQAVLVAEPGAVGVYDHVPVRAGAAVFTMDTASEVFMLHSGKVSTAAALAAQTRILQQLLRSWSHFYLEMPAYRCLSVLDVGIPKNGQRWVLRRSMLHRTPGGAAGGRAAGGGGADVDLAAGGGGPAGGAHAGAGARPPRRGAPAALPAPGARPAVAAVATAACAGHRAT
jgi:hypothetical protein